MLIYLIISGGFNTGVNGKYLVQRFSLTISKSLVYPNLLYVAMSIAREKIQLAQKKYKTQHDKKAKEPKFCPGQKVLLFILATPMGIKLKLIQRWESPYYIVLANSNYTYCLRACGDNSLDKGLVYARHLKIYYDPDSRSTNNPLGQDIPTKDLDH